MSGICGLFNLDDAPVADADLPSMNAMLKQRGPEGTGQWQDGALGLGHTLLATTPELMRERQPFEHRETGCVITADVRLDYRNELLGALGVAERRDDMGDAELILLAYLEWGEECLLRFLGDFAFAIWDPRHKKLFCARDHFGMRPLYYHHAPGQRFVFASDARSILVLPQVPYRIDAGRIADFLVPELEWIDYTSTFYEGVHRLPPGHKMIVTPTSIDIAEYWKPEPGPELGPMSDVEYQQGFLEVFTRAVEERLRAPPHSIGSMLSGGVDSGSIVAVAKYILAARGEGPLPTYSCARHRDDDCAESRAIYASTSMPSIAPGLIHPEDLQDSVDALISGNEEPFDAQCMLLKSIYLEAQEQGISVVLDGGAGDIVLNEGSYIVRLIRSGHLRLAMAEIAAENRIWDETSLASDIVRYTRAAVVPKPVKKMLRRLVSHRRVGSSLKQSLISRDFADSVDLSGRIERLREMFPAGPPSDYATETCDAIRPNIAGGRERYARLAAIFATEARDPFLDKRVVEYCTRLPGHTRMKDGWNKMILRETMADRLPEEVCRAHRKPHLGWLFNQAITEIAANRGRIDLPGLQATLGDFVDTVDLAYEWRRFSEGQYSERIHSAHVLSVWLQETTNRPVAPI